LIIILKRANRLRFGEWAVWIWSLTDCVWNWIVYRETRFDM